MGVIFVAPLLVGSVSLVVWMALCLCARRFRWSRNTRLLLLASVFLPFPVLCVGTAYWLVEANRQQLLGVSASVANEVLAYHDVPESATNVHCLYDLFGGLTEAAEFTVDEQGFLDWAARNGWNPERFESADETREIDSNWLTSLFSQKPDSHAIRRGYYFDTHEGFADDCGLAVLYDLDTGRCYYANTAR